MARAWIPAAALVLAALLAGYGALALVATAHAHPVAGALAAQGRETSSADLSAGLAARAAPDAPAAMLLVDPAPLALGEASQLESYVSGGGDLWILTTDPASALWSSAGQGVRALPGTLYASDPTKPATFDLGGVAVAQPGMRALDLPSSWVPLMTAGTETFRDIDGDGRVSTGEPAGPFVVGATLAVGRGHVTLLSLEASTQAPSTALLGALAARMAPGQVLVYESPSRSAWAAPGVALERGIALLGTGGALALGLSAAAALLGLAYVVLAASARERRAAAQAREADQARAWLERLRERHPDYHERLSKVSPPTGER